MSEKKSVIGKKYGKMTVLSYSERGKKFVKCKCDCGVEKEVELGNLTQGGTKSCGCFRKEFLKKGIQNNKFFSKHH